MLRPKQEKYIQNLIKGMSQRQAYKDAYKVKYRDDVIDRRASDLFNKSEVQVRYKELLKKADDESIMSAIERKKWLTQVIKGDIKNTTYDSNGNSYENEAYMSDKMKAVDILNKMDGEYVTNINGIVDLSFEETLKKVSGKDEY